MRVVEAHYLDTDKQIITVTDKQARIIDDVRAHGDEAVCRALRDWDKVSLAPHQLKATAEELDAATVAPEVDAAIDDAIAHLRASRARRCGFGRRRTESSS